MDIAISLLKANHVGIRELKSNLTKESLKELLVITDRGVPISVNLPYSDILELIDILNEIADPETSKTVYEGRGAVKAGSKGVPVSNLFQKIRKHHS